MAKEKKSKDLFKIILIFILVFTLVPIAVFALVYFTNNDFKQSANEFLRDRPGVIGEYFRKYPTESEKADKEIFLANYYLSISEESSADKLYIIKKSEEELFNNIIKRMNQVSSTKTKNIVKLVRDIELRKDLLHTLYDEIKNEHEIALNQELKNLERQDLGLAIREIEQMVEKGRDNEELGKIFTNMREERAIDILYYIQPNAKNKITTNIETNKRNQLNSLLLQKEKKDEELSQNSKVYEVMDTNKAFFDIGNSEKYKIDELAKIYVGLSVRKASDILINSDDEFVNELIIGIETLEKLTGQTESKTVKIIEAISFKRQYDEKISELVMLYEKMEASDILEVVEKMMVNKDSVTIFEIDDNPIYSISDSTIIMDVLKNMRKQKVSQVLSIIDADSAAEITRQLAI